VGIYLGSAVGLGLSGVVVGSLGGVGIAFPALVPVVAVLVGLLWWLHAPDFGAGPSLRGLTPDWPPRPLDAFRDMSDPGLLARFLLVKLLVNLGMGMSFYLVPVLALDLGFRAEQFLFVLGVSHVFAAPLSLLGGIATDRLPRKYLYVGNWAVEAVMLAAFALAGGPVLFGVGIALFVVQTRFEPAVLAYFFDQFEESESGRAWGLIRIIAISYRHGNTKRTSRSTNETIDPGSAEKSRNNPYEWDGLPGDRDGRARSRWAPLRRRPPRPLRGRGRRHRRRLRDIPDAPAIDRPERSRFLPAISAP
jgi:hypothetical protein